jgi:prolyl-tRNA synthetase
MSKNKTAITPTREENFPEWYQQVVRAADMAENSPVRGCMIIKPNGYALWENMQRIFDVMIKEEDVQNAYFPLLIPLSFMSREAEHVDGFAKECAVVTHHRLEQGEDGLIPSPDAKLEEPYIIRPTSETIIGDSMSRWIQSYRDLPLKLNQWCNVMRWEMRTRLFLRTAEFLWQEGHNAFETAEQANEDARKMLDMYADFAEQYCAVPVIRGEKTADERFPGAVATYTMEAMMQDGKALQAATSHDLGQNFAKSIGIKFQGRNENEEFVHTTSWGLSTRMIGGMIMTHGDDDGMIMPPRVAPYQIAIIPVVREDTQEVVYDACTKLKAQLKEKGYRVLLDLSETRTPDKMWGAVKKGVPLRVEIGGREVEEGTLTHVRRDLGRDSKTSCAVSEFVENAGKLLDDVQAGLLERATQFRDSHIHDANTLDDVKEFFSDSAKIGFLKLPVEILDHADLEAVYKEFGISSRCMPFADGGRKVLIGRSY